MAFTFAGLHHKRQARIDAVGGFLRFLWGHRCAYWEFSSSLMRSGRVITSRMKVGNGRSGWEFCEIVVRKDLRGWLNAPKNQGWGGHRQFNVRTRYPFRALPTAYNLSRVSPLLLETLPGETGHSRVTSGSVEKSTRNRLAE